MKIFLLLKPQSLQQQIIMKIICMYVVLMKNINELIKL